MSTRKRRWSLRLASALLGLAVFLALGEAISAILLQYVAEPAPDEDETRNPPPEVWKARDENKSREKPWYRYRIVCLGDSCTYGLGVKTAETWPKQLERLLNERLGYQ